MNGNLTAGDDETGMGGGSGGEIDLGQPSPSGMSDFAQPAAGAAPSGPEYPSVMLQGGDELSKIPDKGRMMVNHSVISRRVHTPSHGPHKGKKRHEVEVKLHSVRPMRAYKKAPSKSKPNPDEAAMKKLMGDDES